MEISFECMYQYHISIFRKIHSFLEIKKIETCLNTHSAINAVSGSFEENELIWMNRENDFN